jgi:hypothetical protein
MSELNECCKTLLLDLVKKINEVSEKDMEPAEDADMSNGPPALTETQFGMMQAYMKVAQLIEEIGGDDERFTGLSLKRNKRNG